jgi:hypothetical protein
MKVIFTVVAFLFFFIACKESGIPLSKPSTFVKYYSDGNQDQAIDILETSDHGFLILAHADSTGGGGINIIKTDLSGNIVWKKLFRSSGSDLRPSNFVAIKDNAGNDQGYVIVSTQLNTKLFGARLFVQRINFDGSSKDSKSYHTTHFGDTSSYRIGQGGYVFGKGVAQSSISSDFFVVGQIVNADLTTPPQDNTGKVLDMFFAQINGNTLDTVFTRTYGGGTTDLANRLYLDYTQTYAYWGGTRSDDQGVHMRFIKSGFNTQGTIFDLPYPAGDNTRHTGNDFCAYGYGYAFIGNHNISTREISLARVGSEGDLIGPITYFNLKATDNTTVLPISGNSICSTLDGGLLLLGTGNKDAQGIDTDYHLIKVDGTGTKQWENSYGNKYPDVGARVLQSSDGGYVVLGTTTLANVKTVVLIKTDLQGNIQ